MKALRRLLSARLPRAINGLPHQAQVLRQAGARVIGLLNAAKKRAGSFTRALNSSRIHMDAFVSRSAASIPSGSRVLDAGAGDCRYRRHFAAHLYHAADWAQTPGKTLGQIDYECDLASIPVESESFDLVLCTQVLEHVPEPRVIAKELHRVLCLGGQLWLTAPFWGREHEEPYDYYRYTQYGLRYILESEGFDVREIGWLEGYGGSVARQLGLAGSVLPILPQAYGGGWLAWLSVPLQALCKVVFRLEAASLSRLDAVHPVVNVGFCSNYYVVARKMNLTTDAAGDVAGNPFAELDPR